MREKVFTNKQGNTCCYRIFEEKYFLSCCSIVKWGSSRSRSVSISVEIGPVKNHRLSSKLDDTPDLARFQFSWKICLLNKCIPVFHGNRSS